MKKLKNLFVVIDTNVLISALLSSTSESKPFIILNAIYNKSLIPLYNDDILLEYKTVLARPKFHFTDSQINLVLNSIMDYGKKIEDLTPSEEFFPDPKDIMFYEVRMSVEDSYLITGNIKHFPRKPFGVTPAQMVEILKQKGLIPD